MLHNLPASQDVYRDWHRRLASGDVVLFLFPICSDRDEEQGPAAPQPCLVLDIISLGGIRYALLAAGVDAQHGVEGPLDVTVDDPSAVRESGCLIPTRFVGAARLMVSVNHSGFVSACAETASPVIGGLAARALRRLEHVLSRIGHNRGLVAAKRQKGRTARMFDRAVTIEIRRRSRAPRNS